MDDEPVVIKLGSISVEWCDADPGPCVECQREVGFGPVGFTLNEPDGPLCDACLLRLNKGLGGLLWLAHMAREMAEKATGVEDPWRADQCLIVLMTFAKLYDQGADWPRRPAGGDVFMKELQQQMEGKPWDDLLKSMLVPES